MALSSTSAICAGKTALSRTQNRPMSKRHHRHRLSLGVKAVQTPRKPAETVTTPPASNEDEKEAYPFEKQYKDCASCVRFARRRRSCTTTREPISFRFSTRGRETKAYQVQKLSKTRDHIFSETLNYMALFFFWWWFEVLFFFSLSLSLSLSLSVSLSFFPDKTDATTFSLLHHAQTKPGTRLSRDSPTKTRDG